LNERKKTRKAGREGKEREGKERKGKGRKGKGREGKWEERWLTRVDKDRLDACHRVDSDDGMDRLDGLSSDVSSSGLGSVRLTDARVESGETLEVGLEAGREGRVESRARREDGVAADLRDGEKLEGRLRREGERWKASDGFAISR
jgi:hypothetical protein